MKKFVIFLMFILVLPIQVLAMDEDNKELIPGARNGILIDAYSGKIIFERNKDERVAVASMTKMVAQIIILENIEKGTIKWSDVITVSKNAADMGGSQIYIQEGEKITIEELMKGISMASGNDATVQMAEVIAGSEEKFVKLMNKKVKELGLKNTKFVNCTGLDEDGHYSSAYDMAMIARDLVVNHPEILKFSSMYEDYLREDTDNKFWLVNTNKLVKTYEGADGLKTGHTDAAGYCLAATAKRNGLRLIGIVLGEKDSKIRNEETKNLLNYGFNTVKFKKLKEKGECVKKIRIEKADKSIVSVSLKDDLGVIEGLSSAAKYKYDIKMKKIDLPISKNTIVGKIYVKNKEKIVSSQDLIIKEDVNKLSFLQLLFRSIKSIVNGNF